MRISVCEFLRLKTNENWFYRNPGHWVSDGQVHEVIRQDDDSYVLYKGNRKVRTLEYFEGLPSNVIRKLNKGR